MNGNQANQPDLTTIESPLAVVLNQFNNHLGFIRSNYPYTTYMPTTERVYHADAGVITDSVSWSMETLIGTGKKILELDGQIPALTNLMRGRLRDFCVRNQKNTPWWL